MGRIRRSGRDKLGAAQGGGDHVAGISPQRHTSSRWLQVLIGPERRQGVRLRPRPSNRTSTGSFTIEGFTAQEVGGRSATRPVVWDGEFFATRPVERLGLVGAGWCRGWPYNTAAEWSAVIDAVRRLARP